MQAIRAILFYVFSVLITPPFAIVATLILPLPAVMRYRIVSYWARSMLWVMRHVCRVNWSVTGLENITDKPAVIYCKHQSAWETMALQLIFPPQVYIAKRELLWIPFFGWGLATVSTIFINRKNGAAAKMQMIRDAKARMAKGFWIVIFPEGTRIAPGERAKYKRGGAELAITLGVPLVPVAHNAGEFWPKNSWRKIPGTIQMSIGRAIYPDDRNATTLTQVAETWIETEVARLSAKP